LSLVLVYEDSSFYNTVFYCNDCSSTVLHLVQVQGGLYCCWSPTGADTVSATSS